MKKKKKKDYYKVRAISNSSLNYVDEPKKFKEFINGEMEEKKKTYFDLGTAIHMFFLEPKKFNEKYVVFEYTTPTSTAQSNCLNAVKEASEITDTLLVDIYKKFYSTKLSDVKALEKIKKLIDDNKSYLEYLEISKNKAVLKPSVMQLIRTAESGMKAHKKASKLMYDLDGDLFLTPDKNIYNEKEVYWKKQINGREFDLKAMLDKLIVDHKDNMIYLVDVKTTRSISKFDKESFWDYEYDRQLAFYSIAISELFKTEFPDKKIEDYDINFNIVAIDTGTARIEVFNIPKEIILNSLSNIKELLDTAFWHMANDKWDHPREYYINDGGINICTRTQRGS